MYLVKHANAVDFLNRMATDTARRAFLGDPEKVTPKVKVHVMAAHMEMDNAIGLLRKLNTDLSRTAPEKHDIAMRKANEVVARLNTLKRQITEEVRDVGQHVAATAKSHFQMQPSRQALDADLRAWIRETVKAEGGFALLDQAIKESPDEFLGVIYSSPAMLIGMSKDTHNNYRERIMREYQPALWAQLEQVADMTRLPASIDETVRQLPGAFYEPHEVEKYATRVEV